MTIGGISSANIATTVWANATRSLTADPATDAGAATLVWARATRQLTSVASVQILFSQFSGVLAASTTFDARPGAGTSRMYSMAATGGAGTIVLGFYDGATFHATVIGASANLPGLICGINAAGVCFRNTDGANSSNYNYCGWDWK